MGKSQAEYNSDVLFSCRLIRKNATLEMVSAISREILELHKKQADNMAEYSKQITPQVYDSFFSNTLDLSKLPEYQAVTIPMLAICGSKEVRDMKTSLTLLAQNPSCQTMILQGANHDFPMRNAKQLNPMLEKFISECL